MVHFIVWLLFGGVLLLALPLQLLGFPGTWLLLADAAALRWLLGPGPIDGRTIAVLGIMALLGELLELGASVRGARSGPPVRGAVAASILGAFAGGIIGAPVLFGLGALPGMAVGAWAGVFAIALMRGVPPRQASGVAFNAMSGRIRGTALKVLIAAGMVAVILISLVM